MKENNEQRAALTNEFVAGCQSCASTSATTDMKNNEPVCLDPMLRPLHKMHLTIQDLKIVHNDSRCNGAHFHRSEEFSP